MFQYNDVKILFQNQMKWLTLEEAQAMNMEPMNHGIRNHNLCGSWCLGKQALNNKLPYNRPPMFDLCKEKGLQNV